MKLTICFLLFCISLCAETTSKNPENTERILWTPIAGGISGFGLEVLLTRLNYIDRKLMVLEDLQLELTLQRELMESIKSSLEKTLATTSKPKIPPFTSCKDVPSWAATGVYLISLNNDSAPFEVYCEQEKFGGGWIVVQHRFDGSVDFYRNWDEYRDGFGETGKEFWLGLERIHQLTSARMHQLVIEMKDFEGNNGYARYNEFAVGSEIEQYSLKALGSYSGTADDGLTMMFSTMVNKMVMFSTKDRDNDGNYWAGRYEGGWWYGNYGGNSNLNGRYQKDTDEESNWWWNFKADLRGLSFTTIMIRDF